VISAVVASTASPASTQAQSIATIATTLQTASITSLTPAALRQPRPVNAIPVSIHDMVVAASQARTVTTTTATVLPVASLTQAQLQAARLSSGSIVSIPPSAVKGN